MNGSSIIELQADESALRLLAAQRHLYGHAKMYLAVQILLLVVAPCVFAGCALAFPDVRPWAALASLVVLILDVVFLDRSLRHHRQQAAAVQELFDTKVFGLEWPSWHLANQPDVEMIRDASASIMGNPTKRALLAGWYPPAIARLQDERSILLCQRYSIMYGIRIRRPFAATLLIGAIAMFFVLLAVTLYLNLRLSDALLTLAVPALPMLSWTWREWIRQIDHVAAQERIKNIIQKTIGDIGNAALTGDAARSRVRQIQDEIHKSRSSDPLIFDWVYAIARSKSEQTLNAAAEDYVTELLKGKAST